MQFDFDVIIAGAGAIGSCLAYNCASKGLSTLIVEKEKSFGQGVSSRSSEVIHAGIYYEKNSLKSQLCIEGKSLLYDFCDLHHVPHKRLGKYIVAESDAQDIRLREIYENGTNCGVTDLIYLNSEQLQNTKLKNCFSAIFSPSTGIIDSHEYMSRLITLSQDLGALVVFNTEVQSVRATDGFSAVTFSDGYELTCKYFINAAGLGAVNLAKNIEGIDLSRVPENRYVKGNYFKTFKKIDLDNLMYPIPETGGLGIHLTYDLSGNARFGPDVEFVNNENYLVNEDRKSLFVDAISQYIKGITAEDLHADYAGIRPQIVLQGKVFSDFYIRDDLVRETKRIINIMGIESPGITSSLAISKYVIQLLK
jgi:L-2-hydroxyglutarate oxidase LhgO